MTRQINSRLNGLDNAQAIKFFRSVEVWLEKTNTLWVSLAAAAGYSTSIRSVVYNKGRGILLKTRDAFQAAMDANPDGIGSANSPRRDLLSSDATAALAAEIQDYLNRTNTSRDNLAVRIGRDAQGIANLLGKPTRISRNVAARYRRVIAANPDGMTGPEPKPVVSFDLEARRMDAQRIRDERYARLNEEHLAKYGKPLGRAPWEMAA